MDYCNTFDEKTLSYLLVVLALIVINNICFETFK